MSEVSKLARDMAAMAGGDAERSSTHRATVLRTDQAGTTWVSIPGGAPETPLHSMLVEADPGDVVEVSIAGNRATATANASSPAATGRSVGAVRDVAVGAQVAAGEAVTRVGALEADHVSTRDLQAEHALIEDLEATRATVGELEAAAARIGTLEADHVSAADFRAQRADIGALQASTADIGEIRANSAKVGDLTAGQLAAATGYIQALTAGSVTAQQLLADHAAVGDLDANYAHVTNGVIDNARIGYADVDQLSAHYAAIDAANVDTAAVRTAWLDRLMVQTGMVAKQGTVYTLDALQVNASNIKAGTLDVDRLVVTETDGQGNEQKYLVRFVDGQATKQKLDGNVLAERSVTADRLVAHSVTTDELTANNLVGTGGWINLAQGTFAYQNATTLNGITWDGEKLTIRADAIELASGAKPVTASGSQWAVHSSATSASGITGWSDTFTAPTTAKPYVWTRTWTVTDGSRSYGSPACISGAKGDKGDSGASVAVSKTEYKAGTSATSAPTGTWSASVPAVAEGGYLWTRVTYSDGNVAYSVAKQGESGADGTGVTVKSTAYAYQLSTSGTTVPTGTWKTSPQAPTATQYAWTRTTTTYSDGSSAVTYTVGGKSGQQGATGPQGPQGDAGRGVASYSQKWAKSTSSTAAPAASAFSAAKPDELGSAEYLWTRIDTTWSDGATTTGTPAVDLNTSGLWHVTTSLKVGQTSIESTVRGVRDDLDSLEVGGRNLLLKTSGEWGDWVTPTPDKANQSNGTYGVGRWRTSDASMLALGDVLTFSCEVEFEGVTASSAGTFRARAQGAAMGGDTGNSDAWRVGPCAEAFALSAPPADGVYRYSKTVEMKADYSGWEHYRLHPRMDYWGSGSWRIRKAKLERGNKATDWTPAPEDIESRVAIAETKITQNKDAITLRATKGELESATNMLYDADAPSLAAVNGPQNRYWVNAGAAYAANVECSFVELDDPPEPGVSHAVRIVSDGGYSAGSSERGPVWYSNANMDYVPVVPGQEYTFSMWARVASGSAMGVRACATVGGAGITADISSAFGTTAVGSEWTRVVGTFTQREFPDGATWIRFNVFAKFAASQAGAVEMCGFRLVPGRSAEDVGAELKVASEAISMKVSKDGVIGAINLSPETARIATSKVNITGDAVFSAINGDTGTTKISGGKIDATSISIGQSQVSGLTSALNGKASTSALAEETTARAAALSSLANALAAETEGRESAVEGVSSHVDSLADTLAALDDGLNGLAQYVTADSNGLTITAGGSPVVARMTSAGLRFLPASTYANEGDAAASVAEVSAEGGEGVLKVNVAVVLDELRFGHWMWYERPNGHMSLKYTG